MDAARCDRPAARGGPARRPLALLLEAGAARARPPVQVAAVLAVQARALPGLGVAPRRRFVTQWTRWQVVGDTASELTFQAKLFEGTNVLEFHYCAVMPARTLPLGAAASIGIESLSGREGLTTALNRLNAVDPANAFRYTPR